MENSKKARLSLLKKKQAEKGKEKQTALLKKRFISVCSDFTENYRFSNDSESTEIIMALRKIPTNRTGVVDLSRNPDVLEFQEIAELAEYKNNQIWVCCSELSENIFVNCAMNRFVKDFENWREISGSFILLFHNLTDYIYIDEYGAIKKSEIEIREQRTSHESNLERAKVHGQFFVCASVWRGGGGFA